MDMKEAQTSQAKTMVVDDLQENRKAARKKRSPFSIIFEVRSHTIAFSSFYIVKKVGYSIFYSFFMQNLCKNMEFPQGIHIFVTKTI